MRILVFLLLCVIIKERSFFRCDLPPDFREIEKASWKVLMKTYQAEILHSLWRRTLKTLTISITCLDVLCISCKWIFASLATLINSISPSIFPVIALGRLLPVSAWWFPLYQNYSKEFSLKLSKTMNGT